jgi:RimJ/RimL family protein N-acetyltransferase
MSSFSIQPVLEVGTIQLRPLQEDDFADLYAVAADARIWEQHPNKDRWQKLVFTTFFEGALQSQGAFKIIDTATGDTLGSTRFYGYNPLDSIIHIGYTFYGTQFWGKGINRAVKARMLDYAFQFVETVRFHIGAQNVRSQIAIQRLGAIKVAELEVAYHGEQSTLNFVFELPKLTWVANKYQAASSAG